jgi:hypothetical protein
MKHAVYLVSYCKTKHIRYVTFGYMHMDHQSIHKN